MVVEEECRLPRIHHYNVKEVLPVCTHYVAHTLVSAQVNGRRERVRVRGGEGRGGEGRILEGRVRVEGCEGERRGGSGEGEGRDE